MVHRFEFQPLESPGESELWKDQHGCLATARMYLASGQKELTTRLNGRTQIWKLAPNETWIEIADRN